MEELDSLIRLNMVYPLFMALVDWLNFGVKEIKFSTMVNHITKEGRVNLNECTALYSRIRS